ncbi:hypothetical protein ACSFA2_05345 [Variovorax sp. LT2P21]|uniref:hypothetical protein n=1 Tax=Variovorax sp. LT2P21 TaxID=3443731 RepID=UPI003F457356
MNVIESSAQQKLEEAEAVLQRIGTVNDPSPEEHLGAAWLHKAQALAVLGRHAEVVETCDALVAHCAADAGSAPAGSRKHSPRRGSPFAC